jgi:hypothetical protein
MFFVSANKIDTTIHSQIYLQEMRRDFKSLRLFWGCWVYHTNSGQITPNSILSVRLTVVFLRSSLHVQANVFHIGPRTVRSSPFSIGVN